MPRHLTPLVLFAIAVTLLVPSCDNTAAPRPAPSEHESDRPAPRTSAPGRHPERVAKPAPDKRFVPTPSTEITLSTEARHGLLRYARSRCDGDQAEAAAVARSAGLEVHNPLIVTLYKKSGGRLSSQRVDSADSDLFGKVDAAVPTLCKGVAADVYVHLEVVSFTARLPNFGIKGIFDYKVFEPQVTGIAYELDGKRYELDPLRQLELNFGPKSTRTFLAEQFGTTPGGMNSRNNLIVEIYRVIHFGERYPDRAFADYRRGHVILEPNDVTDALVGERLALIGQWYKHNVIDGEVTYKYAPSPMKYLNDERTMVRSTMAVWVLNRLAEHLDDDELRHLGRETIDTYLDRYFNIADSRAQGSLIPSTKPLANGNLVHNRYTSASFIAAAILERKDWETQRGDVDLLLAYAMGFARDDGVMWTQFAQSQYFMPGQLLLAVSYAFGKTHDKVYGDFFEKVWTTYATPLRQMMHLGNEIYIPLAPAWYTQPTASMYHLTHEDRYRDFVFEINDRVAKIYDHNARYQVYPEYDGAMTPKLGSYGNNSVTAAALESVVDAAVVAKAEGDEVRLARYLEVIRHATAYLMRLQYVEANTYYIRERQRVVGGFKTDLVNSHLWMDNVWHLTSAFVKIHRNHLL